MAKRRLLEEAIYVSILNQVHHQRNPEEAYSILIEELLALLQTKKEII